MSEQALRKELQDQIALLRTPASSDTKPKFDDLLGYWTLEVMTTANITGSSDHTSDFEDTTISKMTMMVATMGGWLPALIVGGSDRPCRARVAFWNDGPPYQVDVRLDADTFGHVQAKINGEFNDYTSNQSLTWQFRTGPNEVQLIVADGAERFTFSGNLWDGFYAKWMPVGWSQFGGPGGPGVGGGSGGAQVAIPNEGVGA